MMEPEVAAQAVADFDPEIFVRQQVSTFSQTVFRVTPNAESLIVEPAIRHRGHIIEAVNAHNVTEDVIADAVLTVLHNAVRLAREDGRDVVEDSHVERAMKLECRWFPWC